VGQADDRGSEGDPLGTKRVMDDLVLGIARDAAVSVYDMLVESVEESGETATWKTADRETDEMVYQAHVYAGTAGISLFLSDYGRVCSEPRAIALAEKALNWVMSDDNEPTFSQLPEDFRISLAVGKEGVALGWLKRSQSEGDGDTRSLEKAVDIADHLLTCDPLKRPGLLIGTAGCGILLLRLWEQTGDGKYLDRAREWAEYILTDQWDTHNYLGMGQGFAGIGHFWMAFHDLTGDSAWIDLLHKTAEKLIEHAEPNQGYLNWRRVLEEPEMTRSQWCHGGAGVGQFFARAYPKTNDSRYLEYAVSAGECTYAYGDDTQQPGQCHGLVGKAELFVELFRVTGEPRWHDRASEFIDLTLGYRHETGDGIRWLAECPDVYSPDFMRGAAGVGHFFLRVMNPGLCLPLL
jgi:lantibiotic modifying enzyme